MQGRLPGATCRQRFNELIAEMPPLFTPGPTGHHDAHDPNLPGLLGASPGPLGNNDYAEDAAGECGQAMSKQMTTPLKKTESKDLDTTKLKEQLERHEGKRAKVYKDSRGILTIGIGFNLQRSDAKKKIEGLGLKFDDVKSGKVQLTDDQIQKLFDADVEKAVSDAKGLVKNYDELPEARKRVVVNMIFNLGAGGFGKFKHLIADLEANDFEKAADEMKKSAWYTQVGKRAEELTDQMRGKPSLKPLRKKKPQPLKRKHPAPTGSPMLGHKGRAKPQQNL
jgi:GH24 family phage-related lysozyme (muramidase)